MKKIFACLLAFMMAIVPIGVFAAGSPTFEKMFYCRPAITFTLVNYDDSFTALLADLDVDLVEIDGASYILYNETRWSLDEALYLEYTEPHTLIEWRLPYAYDPTDKVCALLVGDQTDTQVVLDAFITENGNLIFDFTGIEPDLYYFFVLRAIDE